jgi:hypothetical protein
MGKHKKIIMALLAGWLIGLVFSPTHLTGALGKKSA